MVQTTFRVESYKVVLGRELVSPEGFKFFAVIRCEGAEGIVSSFAFLRSDSPPAKNTYDPEEKYGMTYLPPEQYLLYLDLLRNENPVFAYLDSDEPEYNSLHTLREPVGAGDWL